ncbi:MAG: HAD-IC family P-type ATPase, partial [bacterium]
MAGLTTQQALDLKAQGLSNEQIDRTARTTGEIVKENVFTYFNLIFLILAILLIAAGAFNSLTFLPVIIANMLIGIFQELSAKKVLDKLSVLSQPDAEVIRDGKSVRVPIGDLVLNDVVVLSGGNQVCADAEIIMGEVSVNESLLTGEADEISHTKGDTLMSGSFIVSGRCYARLTHVGRDSYISRLMEKARKMKKGEQSEMVRSINHIVIAAGILIIPIGITLFLQGFLMKHLSFSESVTSMVAAVIGMIPEGLYLLVSVTLATASVKLARRKVMLHDMKSIETLARVDVLCVDKTGTITDNDMLVADAVPVEDLSSEKLNLYRTLVGTYLNSLPDDNITMRAMRQYFTRYGNRMTLSTMPFSSRTKYSAVQFNDGTYVLGAPEYVLASAYDTYQEKVTSFAQKGLRVLVFARYLGEDYESEEGPAEKRSYPVPENGLDGARVKPIFYILLQNPIRENAAQTFSYFVDQGVSVRVISGDNPITVSEVA